MYAGVWFDMARKESCRTAGTRRSYRESNDMENTDPLALPEASAEPVALTLEALYKEKVFETTLLNQPHWMPGLPPLFVSGRRPRYAGFNRLDVRQRDRREKRFD